MATRKLDKAEWQGFFDRAAAGLTGSRAEIEVVSLALGDQIAAEWVPLLGISYDPKGDMLDIALDGLDHRVAAPQEVHVEESGGRLASIEIIDRDGTAQIIRLREALMLSGPGASTR